MKVYFNNCYIIALFLVLVSCKENTKEHQNKSDTLEMESPSLSNEVTIMTLTKQSFSHELVCNGKIKAKTSADLMFRSAEVIAHVWVKNGDKVRKGQKIAALDLFKLQNNLDQCKNNLEQTYLEKQNILIGLGYTLDHLDTIAPKVLRLVDVRSGYAQSKTRYELALHELQQATIVSPFDGVVANLFLKKYNLSESSAPFCRIIATRDMDVEFSVLESELALIQKGDKVEITPYASFIGIQQGRISAINPQIDENGMVQVKATVAGNKNLFDGMNVRISVKRSLADQFVIPKTAVVLRSGKEVVFTLKNGKAVWNYVSTSLENMDEYVVSGDGMVEGAQVIVTGNLNLAHDAPVKVIKVIE